MAIKAYIPTNGFDVTPNGSYIFFCGNNDSFFTIYRIDSTSGAVLDAYQHSNFGMGALNDFLTVSEDSSSVHISTGYLSSAWYYCIWDYSDIKMQ